MSPFNPIGTTMSIQSNVTNALNAAGSYNEAVQALKKALAGKAADVIRAALLPHVAAYYEVAVVDGAGKAKGTKVLDKDASKYHTAKKALMRLTDAIAAEASKSQTEEVEVPAELLAAAAKLAKLAREYKDAKSLASRALALAFAK